MSKVDSTGEEKWAKEPAFPVMSEVFQSDIIKYRSLHRKVAHQLPWSSEVSHSGCQPLVAVCSFQINKFHVGIMWAIWIIMFYPSGKDKA